MSTLEQELAEEKKWRGVMTEIADRNQQRAAVYENATEEQNAVVKASLWREFVDAHAALLYAMK